MALIKGEKCEVKLGSGRAWWFFKSKGWKQLFTCDEYKSLPLKIEWSL